MTFTKITKTEQMIIDAANNCEMGDFEKEGVYTFDIIETSGLKKKSAGGAISSLIKKGVVDSFLDEDLQVLTFTGVDFYCPETEIDLFA